MTFEKAFESVKKKFDGASAGEVADFALQITMSDEDCGGTFYVAVKDGVLAVEPYDYKDNDAMLDISKSDLLALIAGRKGPNKVVEEGASIKGDTAVIDLMKAVLKTVKKADSVNAPAPAKTEPVKTEAVKPEAPKKKPGRKPAAKTTAKTTKTSKTKKTSK